MAGRGPCALVHKGSANNETRVKVQFGPTEPTYTRRIESGMGKGLRDMTQQSWWAGGCTEQRLRYGSPARVRLAGQELNSWHLLQPDRSPHRQHAYATYRTADFADQWEQAQESPAGCISTGERTRSSKRALSELLSDTTSYAGSSGPDSLKPEEHRY